MGLEKWGKRWRDALEKPAPSPDPLQEAVIQAESELMTEQIAKGVAQCVHHQARPGSVVTCHYDMPKATYVVRARQGAGVVRARQGAGMEWVEVELREEDVWQAVDNDQWPRLAQFVAGRLVRQLFPHEHMQNGLTVGGNHMQNGLTAGLTTGGNLTTWPPIPTEPVGPLGIPVSELEEIEAIASIKRAAQGSQE